MFLPLIVLFCLQFMCVPYATVLCTFEGSINEKKYLGQCIWLMGAEVIFYKLGAWFLVWILYNLIFLRYNEVCVF